MPVIEKAIQWPRLTIGAVGDVIVHERLRTRQERSKNAYSEIWQDLQPIIQNVQIMYANLEGPVAPKSGKPSGYPVFNFPEQIVKDLKKSGFDFVSTANNHALDQKSKGVVETIQNLRLHKLGYTGTQTGDQASGFSETWWHLSEIKSSLPEEKPKYMAFVACTEMTNGYRDKKNQILKCYEDESKIIEIVDRLQLAGNVAATILLPHWGEEYSTKIDSKRSDWSKKMIDKGVLAILGSHPHVVQKVDVYESQLNRQGLIVYSLGNFISNQRMDFTRFSIMALLSLIYDERIKKYKLEDYRTLPLWIDRNVQKDGTSKYKLKKIFDKTELTKDVQKIYDAHNDPIKTFKSDSEIEKFLKPLELSD